MLNIKAQEIIHVDDQDLLRDLFPGFENTEPAAGMKTRNGPRSSSTIPSQNIRSSCFGKRTAASP